MKFSIEKNSKGIKIELVKGSASKPQSVVLTQAQLELLVGVLNTAVSAEVFNLSVEL